MRVFPSTFLSVSNCCKNYSFVSFLREEQKFLIMPLSAEKKIIRTRVRVEQQGLLYHQVYEGVEFPVFLQLQRIPLSPSMIPFLACVPQLSLPSLTN